jgi:hypothetical protein
MINIKKKYQKYNFQNLKSGKIKRCQITNSKNLITVINLGKQPLSDTLLNRNDLSKKIINFPLQLMANVRLGYAQLNFAVPSDKVYYKKYPYRPGITKEIIQHQNDLAINVKKKIKLKTNSLVIDIGSNDGSLLKQFKKLKMKVLGVEPTNTCKIAIKSRIPSIQDFFNYKVSDQIKKKYGNANLITATNSFAHMTTLHDVMLGIKNLLDKNGFFILENHYMMDIIKYNQYDTIYHEHVRNYSLKSLILLFKQYDMKVIDAKIVKRYNGSIRIIASNNPQRKTNSSVNKILKKEKNFGLYKKSTWKKFAKKIEASKKSLIKIIKKIKKEKKIIFANSCPARCATLLNYCNITNKDIPLIAEQPTSLKLNKYLPGANIPIVKNEILVRKKPDYILLLAWHLKKSIIKELRKKGIKSKLIVPLPMPKIIN